MSSVVDAPVETRVSAYSQNVVCVLGSGLDQHRLATTVGEVGGPGFAVDDEDWHNEPDPRMSRAFAFSADLVEPSFAPSDRSAVAEHQNVAYVLGPSVSAADAFRCADRMLAVIGALLSSGCTAVKVDSSGIAHGRQRWLELAQAAATARDHVGLAAVLYRAFVRRPLSGENVYFSRGMHLLGEADIEIPVADDETGLDWMDALARYLLVQGGSQTVNDGDTFALRRDESGRVLRSLPCRRYSEDDLYFNAWGYWRMTR